MDEELKTKIKSLATNKKFMAKLARTSSKEEVKQFFSAESVDITDKEADMLYQTIVLKELSDDVLENVSGGGITFGIIDTFLKFSIN